MREAQKKYEKKLRELGIHRFKTFALKCSIGTDADVIAKLESVPNKCGYLKDLIRKDIKSKD